MFYKWERNDGEELLETDECIIDYTYISEEHFILIVLLTSYGDLRISYNVRGSGSKQRVIPIREFASSQCADAKALCLVPDASCIALILSNGNVLLVSIKTLVDVPWGHEGIVGDDSLALIEIDTNGNGNNDCLKTPTSALSYCALYSKRPVLIYSNKAGQIFIIDLTTRKLSVGLGAPQSIHAIETFTTSTSVHLLVTGFTGAQWVVPLENGGQSLRETLGNVIPSELQQLHQSAARLSTNEDGKLCFLDIVNHKVQVFDDISMKQCTYESNVPENTWLVHLTSNTLFAICDQTSMKTALHFGLLSSFSEIVYDELEVKLPDERILAIIPITDWQSLSSCIIVTEKGLLRIVPAKTLDEVLVEFIARHHYEMHYCDYLATRLKYERLKLCTMVVRNALRLMNGSNAAATTTTAMDRSSDIQAIIKLAFSAQMDIGNIIRIFNEYDAGDALLPTVLERCATNKSDECRHSIVELYISKLRKNESERDNIERDLRTFLAEHTDISDGIELLLRNGLWSCVAIMVSRSATHHSESVANFLCSDGLEWPVDKVSHLVRTLNGISWNDLSPNAEQLLIRMINYLPHLRSLSHIVSFARIGEGQMNRFHQTGAALYALCTLRLLDATPSFDYTSLPSNLSLSCGSNCITLISEDESVIFIGEFSAGSMKMKDAERNKIVANRYALPRQINVPERVCSVSAGTEHVLCLTTYGNLYSFGKNRFGECGVGHKREVSEASRVRGSFEGIRSICSGHYHSALIDSKGRVFTWGWAIHGQLGHETRDGFEDITVPRLVETIDEEIKAVCCGYAHTIFLSERGIVYGCGNSIYGQLGCGEDIKKRYRPSMIDIPEKVKLISSKYFHGIAVSESQKIYQWGISPLSLKMKAFLAKRVRTANREQQQQQQQQQQQEQSSSNIPSALLNDKSPDSNPLETSQSYLSVSRVEHMISDDIMAVDAGYSHSALITKSGLIYTWGKGLEMQLGHGNKKEQQEPHQLFEPSAVIWQRVSCGLDFTSAISSDGNVFVWGRNDKCQLGVQSLPAPHLTRKLIIKGPKGPRSIQITADSPCVAIPTRLSSVTALVPSETSSDDINDGNLIRFLQRLDADTISNISSELQRNAIVSAPAIFVHLLAGELQRAIELLVQMPIADKEIDALLRNGCDADETHGNIRVGAERQPSSLLAAIWDLTLKHPNFIEQWKAISTLTRTYPIGDLLLSDRKLSAEASVILATKPDMLNGLSATQKLRLLEKWQPEATLQPIEIAQNDLQNMGNRIRYWSCCGNVEKFNASSSSLNNEKRRICSKCSDAWRCAIKSKFSRYA